MKSPLPTPRRADGTLLPAALAALLALLVVVQLALPAPVLLPEAPVARPFRLPPLSMSGVIVDPEITRRPLFAPDRRDSLAAAVPGQPDRIAPLAGAQVVGVASVAGRTRVFLAAPDGRVVSVGLGGRYRGWRLLGLDGNRLRVVRGTQSAALVIGAPAAPSAAAPEPEPEDQP